MTDKPCPDQRILEQLLLGRVPADHAADLEEHFSGCERCAERAGEFNSEDELIVAMQAKQLPPEDDGRVSELIEHLRGINAEAETSRLGDTQPGTLNRSGASLAELSDLLDPPEQEDEIGRIGQYRVLDVLDVGGMGIVLHAEDPHLKRRVAIKVMKGDVAADESAKSRFLREAQATAAIEHDNIVTIYQVAEHRGLPYYAMQFLRGESLEDRLKREGPLGQSEVLRIGREIAEGLAAAQAEGLLHRDIKPDNIWLEEKTGRAKIVDFGLARDTKDEENITLTGMVLGTPRYMAPEQALGKTVDQRCDLFSLGCVMYHVATGQPPFAAENLAATLMAVINKPPQPVTELQPEIDYELVNLIDRLLAKDPGARFPSAEEVVDAIRRIERRLEDNKRLETVGLVHQPTLDEQHFKSQKRRRVMIGTAVATGLLAIAFGIIFVIQTQTGIVRVEVNDDNLEVLIDEEKITVTDKKWKGRKKTDKHRLAIKLGEQTLDIGKATVFTVDGRDVEHHLTVKLGGVALSSNEFEVVRGDKTALTISLERREPEISAPLDANAPPRAVAPFDEVAAKQHQQAWAKYLGLPVEKKVELPDGETIAFMLIPPGEFMMGSTDEEQASFLRDKKAARAITRSSMYYIRDEVPQHRVRITRPFYLGMCEVTQAQWQALMGSNPSNFQDHLTHPVEEVSWDDIQPFLAKLNEGLSATEPRFALPTEAQWEFACRAGTIKTWHIGDSEETLNEVAWFAANSYDSTHPVGRLKPNSFGLHDMHGNVGEWCADWHAGDYYSNTPSDDPAGPPRGSHRVVRGGGSIAPAAYCRSAFRTGRLPDNRHLNLGFRLAMTIDTTQLTPASPTVADNDRRAAEYIVSVGGRLITDRSDQWTDVVPDGPFRLKGVGLAGRTVTDEGLAAFQGCTELETLDLNRASVTDAGVIHFKNCEKLKELTLGTIVTDEGLANFQDCDRLERLTLTCSTGKMTDAGLAFFKNCKELSFLYLHHASVGDAGLASLKGCEKLSELILDRSKVTDGGLAQFKDWKELKSLTLSFTVVGDDGLAHLKDYPSLTYLSLKDAPQVTDAGLAHLQDCKGLETLVLRRSPKVSAKMVDQLKEALPNCSIDWDGPSVGPPTNAASSNESEDEIRAAATGSRWQQLGDQAREHTEQVAADVNRRVDAREFRVPVDLAKVKPFIQRELDRRQREALLPKEADIELKLNEQGKVIGRAITFRKLPPR